MQNQQRERERKKEINKKAPEKEKEEGWEMGRTGAGLGSESLVQSPLGQKSGSTPGRLTDRALG